MFTMTKEELDKVQKQGIKNLITYAGTKSHLALMLGVSHQVVGHWINRGSISKKGVKLVLEHSRFENFTLENLRPDLVEGI